MAKKKTILETNNPNLKKSLHFFIMLALVLASFTMTYLFYPQLPATMASHWGLSGEANGFMPKEQSAYLLPSITAILAVALYFIPRLDPLQKNIKQFEGHYTLFIINMISFFVFLQALVILWNLGVLVNFNQAMRLALGVLIFSVGSLMSHAKRNYFIGIRTPWTLNSEKVWDKTHAFGGKAFKGAAVLMAIGVFFPPLAFYFIFIPIMLAAIGSVVYSYVEYVKQKKN